MDAKELRFGNWVYDQSADGAILSAVSARFVIIIRNKGDEKPYYFSGLRNSSCFWAITDKIEEAYKFDSAEQAVKQKKHISFGYIDRFDFEINGC